MSSILKALKKLEDEKAPPQPAALKIDSDILRGESVQRHSTLGLVAAAVLLFAGGGIATYLYMKPVTSPIAGASGDKPSLVQPERLSSPRAPAASSAEIKTEQLPEDVVIVPARHPESIRVLTPKLQKQAGAYQTGKPAGMTRSPIEHKPKDQGKSPSVAEPDATTKTVPLLRVNGIAFQDGISDSVAIVNGVPVSSGSVIEGVRVETIQKDRVRFSHKGETFEIPLGKANR